MSPGTAVPPGFVPDTPSTPVAVPPGFVPDQATPTFSAANEKDAAGNAVIDTGVSGALAGAKEGLTEAGLNPVAAVKGAVNLARQATPEMGQLAAASQAFEQGDLKGGALHLAQWSLTQGALNPRVDAQRIGAMGQAIARDESARAQPLQDANAAFANGDYKAGATHLFRYLLRQVGLGPVTDEAAQEFHRGEYAKAIAHLASFTGGLGAGAMFGLAGETSVGGGGQPGELAQFAQAHDIPLDAATATDNRFVRGAQALADNSLGGSVVAKTAEAQRNAALGRTGDYLVSRAGPRALAPTGEDAGLGTRNLLADVVKQRASDADAAYGQADQLAAANPRTIQTGTTTTTSPIVDASGKPITTTTPTTQTLQAPIDVRAVKRQLQPLYDDLARQAQLVPLQGAKGRALVALDRIMHAPDFMSLPQADQAAGDLGALAGRPEFAELRTSGQGTAARAFGVLRNQVDQTAAKIPGMLPALKAGRAATTARYDAADLLDQLTTAGEPEPVAAYKKLTKPGDASIALLRKVQDVAPDAVSAVGQAKLQDIIGRLGLTGDAPLSTARGALVEWQKLGPETKRILMGSRSQAENVDRFFRLAAKFGESANPSRTALTHAQQVELTAHGVGAAELLRGDVMPALAASGYTVSMTGLAKLLHSPLGVKLLTRGLTIPVSATAMRTAWLAELASAAQTAGVSLIPVTAQRTGANTSPSQSPK